MAKRTDSDVLFLQETRVNAAQQKEIKSYLLERGWQIFWGGPGAPKTEGRKTNEIPGVATLVQDSIRPKK